MNEDVKTGPEPGQGGSHHYGHRGSDPIGKVTTGLMVIWLGITLMSRGRMHPWWAYMLSGFGVILLVEALFRMARPEHRAPVGGKFIGGLVMIVLGSLFISGFADWWAVVLVVVGAVFLLQGIRGAMRR
jgi:hypothetical protein